MAMNREKELVLSFINFLQTSKGNTPRIQQVIDLLQDEFSIHSSARESDAVTVNLLNAFTAACEAHESDDEAKFKAFLHLLEEKGYFEGLEPGSEDYQSRVERARKKFEKHNNPFSGLTAEEVKTKGNEFMSQGKYQDAVSAYTKAIELSSENPIYFSNRAAAYTHLKDYAKAIADSEHAIALNPKYAKSYSRLGIAYFYEKKYTEAASALRKACELDPENASYKEDLQRAEEKAAAVPAGGGMGGAGGFPGGFPDMSQLSSLMSNPEFLRMAENMSQNPGVQSMLQNLVSGNMNMADLARSTVDDGGITRTPFGDIPTSRLQEFPQLHNPKFAAIREDIQQNGIGAISKYMGDPDVISLMSQMSSLLSNPTGHSTPSQ